MSPKKKKTKKRKESNKTVVLEATWRELKAINIGELPLPHKTPHPAGAPSSVVIQQSQHMDPGWAKSHSGEFWGVGYGGWDSIRRYT